jgi:hypothetical protein
LVFFWSFCCTGVNVVVDPAVVDPAVVVEPVEFDAVVDDDFFVFPFAVVASACVADGDPECFDVPDDGFVVVLAWEPLLPCATVFWVVPLPCVLEPWVVGRLVLVGWVVDPCAAAEFVFPPACGADGFGVLLCPC